MNSHFLSSAQRTLSLSLSSPLLTPMVNLKELTNTQEDEEEEKAIQVTELKTRYNQRLMKPLQVNRKVKNYDNMGMINSGRQRRLIKHTITREDNEGKQLARQARELSRIAARHDKEAGVLKRKLKKIENRNYLEEHLEGDTVECIKAINERAEKLKRVRSLEDKKLYMLAMKKKQQEEEEQQNAENKDPLEMIQKQIEDSNLEKAEKEIQQIKLRLKQMNSNTQFRHAQRKLLLMRSMEASTINGQDETGESINDGEEKRNLLKSGSMLLKLEASPLLPHSVLHEKSNNTTLSGQDKPGRTFMKSKSTLNTSMNPSKEKNAYKSYDLVGSKRERRTYFVETDGSLEVSSVGLVTPPYIFSANELNLRPSEIDLPLDTEMNCQNDNDLSPHAKRILSQPAFKDGRNIEIFEREEEQCQNNRMNVLRGILIQENDIPAEQEKKPRAKRPKLFVRTGKDEGSKGIITSGESSKTPLYHNRESSSKKLIPQIEHSVTEVGDRIIRRPKDGYRLNLLDNMRKSKEIKTATVQESSNESSQAPKRWLGLTQASLLDAYKWKDRERIGKRGKTKKNIKGNFGKSTREEITITDSDNKIFLRELSAEKKPVKEEVQGLLTRYGYEESKADIVNGMTSKTFLIMRTPTGYGENREKLNRVEKFLHKAFQKSSKINQVE